MTTTQDSQMIMRLRKELIHARSQIGDITEELEEKTNQYINAIRERDEYKNQIASTKESIQRIDDIVQSKVGLALEKERKELQILREENSRMRQTIQILDSDKSTYQDRERDYLEKITALTGDLQFYAQHGEIGSALKRIEQIRQDNLGKDKKIMEMNKDLNDLSNKMEEIIAENRTLRQMANVPLNFGIDLDQVKLHDREKIYDYKRIITKLQEDNYSLEEERARLKHQLKQQSIMYDVQPSQNRYKNLSPEQIQKVDQFVFNLLAGTAELPSSYYKLKKENDGLRKELETLEKKGFDMVRAQIEQFFKGKGGGASFGIDSEQLSALLKGNEQMMGILSEMAMNRGLSVPTGSHHFADVGRFRPPVPQIGFDGDISQGQSYKFGTQLQVSNKLGQPGIGDKDKYDMACYQLQLIECYELIRRKDETILHNQTQIDDLYKTLRDYLLTQDLLYRDFTKSEKDFALRKEELERQLGNLNEKLLVSEMKVKKLEEVVNVIQKKSASQSLEFRIIELTKENSILDVNLLKLTRQYECVREQEMLIRRSYHNYEADMCDKDRFVQDRINQLKQWKAEALVQMKMMFTKLKVAVPLTEYQILNGDLDLYKTRYASMIQNMEKATLKVSSLQNQLRKNMDAEEKMKVMNEINQATEFELDFISKRLEAFDPKFRKENEVFHKIVARLKQCKISPKQAFDAFDVNKDGHLTKQEFKRALDMLKITDLLDSEVTTLIESMDVNSDGSVQYQEFLRKLQRHGVRSRTSEEQIIFLIMEALKYGKIHSLSDAFEIIDKSGNGYITKEDFKDLFRQLNVKSEQGEIDKFIEHFWKDKEAGIDYKEFLRIFSKYQVEADMEEKAKIVTILPEPVVRMKKNIFDKINGALKKANLSLKVLFDKVDADRSGKIETQELEMMFELMHVEINKQEVAYIFQSIDIDMSKNISYAELVQDFDHYCQTDLDLLLKEERDKAVLDESKRALGQTNQAMTRYNTVGGNNNDIMQHVSGLSEQQNKELQRETKIAILESREKQLNSKIEGLIKQLRYRDNECTENLKVRNIQEKQLIELHEKYQTELQKANKFQQELHNTIPRSESEQIRKENELLLQEKTEAKAAMLSYKNMVEVVADQVRSLKLAQERKKDENENLINALREVQSNSLDQQRIGKLYYIVMLSRWQEAAANKKYDLILNENKALRNEIFVLSSQCSKREADYNESQTTNASNSLIVEQLKQALNNKSNKYASLEQVESMNVSLKEVADAKTDLEDQYFQMRSELGTIKLTFMEMQSKAETFSDIVQKYQNSNQDELSKLYFELAQKLQGIRHGELAANRIGIEATEKCTYLSRLLKASNDQVKILEVKVAEFESKMHRREEEFRKQDNERMRMFFAGRFEDQTSQQKQMAAGENVFQGLKSYGGPGATATHLPYQGIEPSSYSMQQPGMSHATHPNLYGGNVGNDAKSMDQRIKQLQEQLAQSEQDRRQKDAVIDKFKQWQLADQYLAQDEVLRDAMSQQQFKISNAQDKQTQEMAAAAQQTIQTLHEMLEQKNNQIQNKETLIDKLRKQMLDHQEQAAMEIAALNNKLSEAGLQKMAEMNKLMSQQNLHMGNTRQNSKYIGMMKEDLQNLLLDKDKELIMKQANEQSLHEQVRHLTTDKLNLKKMCQDLQNEIENVRYNNQVQANKTELDKIRKVLKEKDDKNQKLQTAIDALRNKMMDYEIDKEKLNDDDKGHKIKEGLLEKEHKTKVDTLNKKIQNIKTAKAIDDEDLNKLKVQAQEWKQKEEKFRKEIDEYKKAIDDVRKRVDKEISLNQHKEIELNKMRDERKVMSTKLNPYEYQQMQEKVHELERDIYLLKCQQKTVVVYNKETATFEYIGEPAYLNNKTELTDIEEIIGAIKHWLHTHDRLTVGSIFASLDKQNFGELSLEKFEIAMNKVGIILRALEKQVLAQYLDLKHIGFLKYRPLLRELQGIPQVEFMHKDILKIASLCENRDLDETSFKLAVDHDRKETMDFSAFRNGITGLKSANFSLTDAEVESIFKYVTKSARATSGTTLSMTKFSEKVFAAFDAILIEKIKDSILRSPRALPELYQKHKQHHDKEDFITPKELENLMLDANFAMKPAAFARVLAILCPGQKDHHKINLPTLHHFFTENGALSASRISQSLDLQPQPLTSALQESSEEMQLCRSAARKILTTGANYFDMFSQIDRHQEGLLGKDEVQRVFEEHKVPELTQKELYTLINFADKGNKGYIAYGHFVDQLQTLAVETKDDAMLRRFGVIVKNQGINLKVEMAKYDTSKTGTLDLKTFSKTLKQMAVALTDDEIQSLFLAAELPGQKGWADVKNFLAKVTAAQKYRPPANLSNFKTSGVRSQKGMGGGDAGAKAGGPDGAGGAFENWELEKKYKKKLDALKQQIEECKKEIQNAEKQTKHWQGEATKFEREKNSLQTRLVDQNSKPPKTAAFESQNEQQIEHLQQLKDQVYYLQQTNQKLEKTIQVEVKAELGKIMKEKEKLEEDKKRLIDENKRLEIQKHQLVGKPMTAVEKREELELMREKKVQDLERVIAEYEKKELDMHDQLCKAEERLLDLKFEKQTFDLQTGRLQKRITDLEQYKLASSKYSAVQKHHEDEEVKNIQEISSALHGEQKQKSTETVKLKNKPSKSVIELEMVIESLKRVIEKQRAQNEDLQKQVKATENKQEKLTSQKQLNQKIEGLELMVHSHEMQGTNLEEKDKTIKSLEKNVRRLTESLKIEVERYNILEGKYKDVLVKFNVLAKENARNQEYAFGSLTGVNVKNHEEYLTTQQQQNQQSSQKAPQASAQKENLKNPKNQSSNRPAFNDDFLDSF